MPEVDRRRFAQEMVERREAENARKELWYNGVRDLSSSSWQILFLGFMYGAACYLVDHPISQVSLAVSMCTRFSLETLRLTSRALHSNAHYLI